MANQQGNKWSQLLDEINASSSGGDFFFPKSGRTRLRLVAEPGTEDKFYTETTSVRFGKKKTKFIILAEVLGTDQGELSERWVGKVVPVVVSRSVFKQIVGFLSEGFDLYTIQGGHGITIHRAGSGLETTYTVMPSTKVVPLSPNVVFPETSLEEYAKAYAARAEAEGDGEEEGPRGGNKPNRGVQTASLGGTDW